jgi:hypothetical protein
MLNLELFRDASTFSQQQQQHFVSNIIATQQITPKNIMALRQDAAFRGTETILLRSMLYQCLHTEYILFPLE